MNKDYLGDSVYVEEIECKTAIRLTTENGAPEADPSNTIILENETLGAFLRWAIRHGWITENKITS